MPVEGGIEKAVVGLGNPFHGDDAIGLVVAQAVHRSLRGSEPVDLLEVPNSGFALAESLVGYRRVLIIDALIDPHSEVGTVKRLDLERCYNPTLSSLHTGGFHDGLAVGRATGLRMPSDITLYGVVVREPQCFSERLSSELESKLPAIVVLIVEESRGLQEASAIKIQTRDKHHAESFALVRQ